MSSIRSQRRHRGWFGRESAGYKNSVGEGSVGDVSGLLGPGMLPYYPWLDDDLDRGQFVKTDLGVADDHPTGCGWGGFWWTRGV